MTYINLAILLVAPLALAAVLDIDAFSTPACNADNCARAVTGTRRGTPATSSAQTDCSSFMMQVLPTTVTQTSTVTYTISYSTTITSTTTVSSDTWEIGFKRTAAPEPLLPSIGVARRQGPNLFSVPTYATACSDIARYSSACSCWGITASTSTIMATTTATATATVTSIVIEESPIPEPCYPRWNYGIRLVGGILGPGGGASGQTYATSLFSNIKMPQDCCIKCQTTENCYSFSFSSGKCKISLITAGNPSQSDLRAKCPYGSAVFESAQSGTVYGLGPCGAAPMQK